MYFDLHSYIINECPHIELPPRGSREWIFSKYNFHYPGWLSRIMFRIQRKRKIKRSELYFFAAHFARKWGYELELLIQHSVNHYEYMSDIEDDLKGSGISPDNLSLSNNLAEYCLLPQNHNINQRHTECFICKSLIIIDYGLVQPKKRIARKITQYKYRKCNYMHGVTCKKKQCLVLGKWLDKKGEYSHIPRPSKHKINDVPPELLPEYLAIQLVKRFKYQNNSEVQHGNQ